MTDLNTPTPWFTYILRCADNTLYTGITTNVERREQEHNSKNKTAAKYTRIRQPVKLAYIEKSENRSEASKREYAIKQLTKKQKEQLIIDYQLSNLNSA